MAGRIRLFLVDDHAVIREGLERIFAREPDIEIVGQASDGAEAISNAMALKPDVMLMDLSLPRVSGLETLVAIKKSCPETKVVILTVSERREDIVRSLRHGADGYLLKSASADELVAAVRKSAGGESVLSPSLTSRVLKEFQVGQNGSALSAREEQVLKLVARGLSNVEIGQRLFISESTVRTYLRRLFHKLNIKNRMEAGDYAREHLDTSDPG